MIDSRKPAAALLALACLCWAGCWGDVVEVFPDGGAQDTSSSPVEPELFPGGGTGGGPIGGRVNVYLVDAEDGTALAGAGVVLDDGQGGVSTGTTDPSGLVVFEDGALSGEVDLHALAEGYAVHSLLGLGSANATLALVRSDAPPAEGTATVTGEVLGWDDLPSPGFDQERVVTLHFGLPTDRLVTIEDPCGGEAEALASIAPDADGGGFEVQVPAGRGALYALAGILSTQGTTDESDDSIAWHLLGFEAGVDAPAGGTAGPVVLDLSVSLSVEMHAGIHILPASFAVKDVDAAVDLGEDGTIWLPHWTVTTHQAFAAPQMGGSLEGSDILVVGRGDQEVDGGPGAFQEMPRGRSYVRELDSFEGWNGDGAENIYAIETMQPPPDYLVWDGSRLTCFPPAGTDLGAVAFDEAATGRPLWRAIVIGELPDAVEAPQLPEGWGWGGLPADGIVARLWVGNTSADTASMRFEAFHGVALETAENAVLVE